MELFRRIRSEYLYARGLLRALRRTVPVARQPERTFPTIIEEIAARQPDKPALLSERETLSWGEYDRRANRYARWALAEGIGKDDTVGLLMPNRPEYLVIWLGITRIGGVVALFNTQLAGSSLKLSLEVAKPKLVIVADEFAETLETADPGRTRAYAAWRHGGAEGTDRIDRAVASFDDAPLRPEERRPLTQNDRALLIYTSGTTGLPKAANVNHYRLLVIINGFSGAQNTRASDRGYVCVPLYHSSGLVGMGVCLSVGGSIYIRERFSARRFWDDVADNDCTIFQYVGEICRYLTNAAPHPKERAHRLRLCCGNGVSADIWPAFHDRFGIPTILEVYGATEGNVAIFNLDNTPGSVGRIPKWVAHRFPVRLVRFDPETEEPVRGPDGFCQTVETGEPGELIGEIVNDPAKPAQRFEGYADTEASRRKVLTDVFRRGDRWFRSGDLLRQDRHGYFYFVDRVGQTFRWKAENVSTQEVAQVLARCPGIVEVTVYGVRVPHHEGRAGMATIVAEAGLSLEALARHLEAELPPYARPLFLRRAAALATTGTYKQRKIELMEEGFDPARIADPLYFAMPESGRFELLGPDLHRRLLAGSVRL
jgi:fatty-acyl-CoA synthase